ncbi:hypothetical protein WG66_007996 [Moniliophthora roreri]|nr:hypothetical protein WG66_007996 [Moniliophthora roreri]
MGSLSFCLTFEGLTEGTITSASCDEYNRHTPRIRNTKMLTQTLLSPAYPQDVNAANRCTSANTRGIVPIAEG